MASSSKSSLLLFRCSLVLFIVLSFFGGSDARVLRSHARVKSRCDFDSVFSFGEGSSSVSNGLVMVHHVASASFASPEAIVMNPGFFIKNRIQPPQIEGSLDSQIDNFVTFLGPRLSMPYKDRAKKLQGSLFFINWPGIADYKQAFLQGKTVMEVSKLVPEVVSTIKNQIRKLIFSGASNLIVSGVPHLKSLPGFSRFLRSHKGLNWFGRLHNDHLQQALVELKLEFP